MDPNTIRLNALTGDVAELRELMRRSQATTDASLDLLLDRMSLIAARSELLDRLMSVLLQAVPEHVRTVAIAAAEIRGEELAETGPPAVARHYAQLLRDIVPTRG